MLDGRAFRIATDCKADMACVFQILGPLPPRGFFSTLSLLIPRDCPPLALAACRLTDFCFLFLQSCRGLCRSRQLYLALKGACMSSSFLLLSSFRTPRLNQPTQKLCTLFEPHRASPFMTHLRLHLHASHFSSYWPRLDLSCWQSDHMWVHPSL